MLGWITAVLEANRERSKMRMDPRVASSHGLFMNLSVVILHMCEPFLEPMNGKAWGKVDVRWVAELSATALDHLESWPLFVICFNRCLGLPRPPEGRIAAEWLGCCGRETGRHTFRQPRGRKSGLLCSDIVYWVARDGMAKSKVDT